MPKYCYIKIKTDVIYRIFENAFLKFFKIPVSKMINNKKIKASIIFSISII